MAAHSSPEVLELQRRLDEALQINVDQQQDLETAIECMEDCEAERKSQVERLEAQVRSLQEELDLLRKEKEAAEEELRSASGETLQPPPPPLQAPPPPQRTQPATAERRRSAKRTSADAAGTAATTVSRAPSPRRGGWLWRILQASVVVPVLLWFALWSAASVAVASSIFSAASTALVATVKDLQGA